MDHQSIFFRAPLCLALISLFTLTASLALAQADEGPLHGPLVPLVWEKPEFEEYEKGFASDAYVDDDRAYRVSEKGIEIFGPRGGVETVIAKHSRLYRTIAYDGVHISIPIHMEAKQSPTILIKTFSYYYEVVNHKTERVSVNAVRSAPCARKTVVLPSHQVEFRFGWLDCLCDERESFEQLYVKIWGKHDLPDEGINFVVSLEKVAGYHDYLRFLLPVRMAEGRDGVLSYATILGAAKRSIELFPGVDMEEFITESIHRSLAVANYHRHFPEPALCDECWQKGIKTWGSCACDDEAEQRNILGCRD